MSSRRIRRKGPDGKDIVRDVDLGPAAPYSAGRAASGVRRAALASPVGHMQPIDLRNRPQGGGWAASRAFTTDSKKQPPGRPSHELREDEP